MGAEMIVTVRMPASLLRALKERTQEDHFSDLSEQMRSIIRHGCMRYTNPVTSEIRELKSQLKEELLRASQEERKEAIITELKGLLGGGQ